MATKACSEAFERSHPADVEAMMKLIKECVVWHSKLVKEAATGVCVCGVWCVCGFVCVWCLVCVGVWVCWCIGVCM